MTKKQKNELEFLILFDILDRMEATGNPSSVVRFSANQNSLGQMNTANKTSFTIEELQQAVNKCLANKWLTHNVLANHYEKLVITEKGLGAAHSRKRTEEIELSRSLLKKTSDYVLDHKGLFLVLGFLLALGTFALKLIGG